MFRSFFIFFTLSLASLVSFESDALSKLYLYGDGLNIEGGVISKHALQGSQLWANIGFILDKPLIDHTDLDEITAANSYLLKESSILEYNEPQAALIQALIIKYYLNNGNNLVGIAKEQPVRIVVHVHRNRSGPAHLDLLERLLDTCFKDCYPIRIGERKYRIHNNIICFYYGTIVDFSKEFEEADIIISISLIAGLNPKWKSGTPVLPKAFIPFDLHSMNLVTSAKFNSQNHLLNVLPEIIDLQSDTLIEQINHEFASPNPEKIKMKARKIKKEDLMEGIIFQANGMFYPKKLIKNFEIY